MNKKMLVVLLLAVLLLIAASAKGVALTVVNRSGMKIAVGLVGEQDEHIYYLQVPEGSRQHPTERVFEIPRDTYSLQIYYLEAYDPVYGYTCNGEEPDELELSSKTRISILPCDARMNHLGETGYLKLNGIHSKKMGK